LAKEVRDEKAAAEKARKVGEAMEAKKRREEEAAQDREEREEAAAARKLGFEEGHRALHATFKAKEINAAALEREEKGIEESAAESAEQSQVVESEEGDGEDKMEESDEVQVIEIPVSKRGTAPKKTKRKAATSGAVYAVVSGLVSHLSQLSHLC
jgi:hypothetical protein